jgi:hypothetical protein
MVEYNKQPKINNFLGDFVTRIIKTSTPGKERIRLSKAIVITIREFMRLQEPDHFTQDMIAFIIMALQQISNGIDKSVAAWEKRGYWVKADKYQMEWQWTEQFAKELETAFQEENWRTIPNILVKIMSKFNNIKVSDRHRMGQPWKGVYKKYLSSLEE